MTSSKLMPLKMQVRMDFSGIDSFRWFTWTRSQFSNPRDISYNIDHDPGHRWSILMFFVVKKHKLAESWAENESHDGQNFRCLATSCVTLSTLSPLPLYCSLPTHPSHFQLYSYSGDIATESFPFKWNSHSTMHIFKVTFFFSICHCVSHHGHYQDNPWHKRVFVF